MQENLEQELAAMIIETCRVTDPLPAAPSPDTPLFGAESPFGLDSLDALEVVVAVQRRYKVRIDSQERGRQALQSLGSLADFIRRNAE